MYYGLYMSAAGAHAQNSKVEVLSNNLANVNTVGFKRQSAVFEDLLYQTLEQPGAQSSDQGNVVPTGVQIGAGVKAGSVYRITGQGTMTNTGTFLVNSTGHETDIFVVGAAILSGAGKVTMTDNVNNHIQTLDTGTNTLTNMGNTISGAGVIGDDHMTFINQSGIVNANGIHTLTIDTGFHPVTNNGTARKDRDSRAPFDRWRAYQPRTADAAADAAATIEVIRSAVSASCTLRPSLSAGACAR